MVLYFLKNQKMTSRFIYRNYFSYRANLHYLRILVKSDLKIDLAPIRFVFHLRSFCAQKL